MDFLLNFNEYNSPILEHYYDSVINKIWYSNESLKKLIDYINKMINEKQAKNINKHDDSINFTIRDRKYTINKNGILTLFKIKSTHEEIKNLDVLLWIFGNKTEAMDALKTLYSNRIRTINKYEIEKLKELNNKVGKRSEDDFNKNFKTAKQTKREEIKIDTQIDKGVSLKFFNQLSKMIF
jgi:phosphoketolase